jgi:hypothetical protein
VLRGVLQLVLLQLLLKVQLLLQLLLVVVVNKVLARPPPEDVWNRRGGASPEDACKRFADSSQATHVA